MNFKKMRFVLAFGGLAALLLSGCWIDRFEDHPTFDFSYTKLNVRMTDDPANFEEVNIELEEVVIKGPGGSETISLNTNTGIYNLLDYQDGLDTVIGTANITLDEIKEVRLILGDDNTVVVDGEEKELKVPSGMQSGIKIKVCLDLAGLLQYDLLIDFVASESIHQTGNGKYIMRPVIRVVNDDARCGDDDDNIDLNDLTPDVLQYLDNNYTGYDFTASYQDLCGGDEAILVIADDGANRIDLFFTPDGDFLQSAVMIEEAMLPGPVSDVLDNDYAAFDEFERGYEISRFDGDTWYQVELRSQDDDKLRLVLDEQGGILCEE